MDRRGPWQAAWGVVAAIAAAFDAGLVVARITSDAPLWAIAAATVVMVVALYFVFVPAAHRWPFNRPDTIPQSSSTPTKTLTGAGSIKDSDLTIRSSADQLIDGPSIERSRLNADHQPGRRDWPLSGLDSAHEAAREEPEEGRRSE
jgi:hypothetical protein